MERVLGAGVSLLRHVRRERLRAVAPRDRLALRRFVGRIRLGRVVGLLRPSSSCRAICREAGSTCRIGLMGSVASASSLASRRFLALTTFSSARSPDFSASPRGRSPRRRRFPAGEGPWYRAEAEAGAARPCAGRALGDRRKGPCNQRPCLGIRCRRSPQGQAWRRTPPQGARPGRGGYVCDVPQGSPLTPGTPGFLHILEGFPTFL